MLLDKNCKEFLRLLASGNSVPGGGGASALAGALAGSLTAMVCNLTLGKKSYEDVQIQISEILLDVEIVRSELQEMVEADARVFQELMDAYRLPKLTEGQQDERKAIISEKSKGAAEVPWNIAVHCRKVLELANQVAEIGNKQAISDASVSALLARAALRSALYNVKINFNSIDDSEYICDKLAAMEELQTHAEELEAQVLVKTDKIIAGE